MFLNIVKGSLPNIVLTIEEEDLTVEAVAEKFKLDATKMLLCTPFYRKLLKPEDKIFKLEERLKLNYRPQRYPPAPYHIRELTPNDQTYLSIPVEIKTQSDIEFPSMIVDLTYQEAMNLTARNLLGKCSMYFGYDCNQQTLSANGEILDGKSYISIDVDSLVKTKYTYSCQISDAALAPIKHRIYLCQQIVESEEFYIKTLITMITFWQKEIKSAGLFNDEVGNELFKNVSSMIQAHEMFLETLKQQKVSFKQTVCETFLNFVPYFKVSSAFVSNYQSNDAYILKKLSSRSTAKAFQEMQDRCPDKSGRSFAQFYVSPVQRYPKYTLLLRDLDKRTPRFHPDKEFLPTAIEAMTTVNGSFNSSSFVMRMTYVMNELQKEIGNSFKILIPRRQLLMQSEVKIFNIAGTTGNGFINLFNDILLITDKHKKSQEVLFYQNLENLHFKQIGEALEISDPSKITISFKDSEEIQSFYEKLCQQVAICFSNIECADPYATWRLGNDSNIQISNHAGCVVNDRALFFGGRDSSFQLRNIFTKYSIDSNHWTTTDDCPVPPRFGHTFVSCGSCAYIGFGKLHQGMCSDIWKFDQIDGTWTEIKKNVPEEGRFGHTCCTWGTKLVFFGGMTPGQQISNSVLILETETNHFYEVETEFPPQGRFMHSAVITDDDKMVVMYGNSKKKSYVNEIDILDLKTMRWSYIPISVDREYSGMNFTALKNGRFAYFIGGTSGTDTVPLHALDLKTYKIIEVKEYGNSPKAVVNSACVMYNGEILIYGGRESPLGGSVLSSLYYLNVAVGEKDLPETPVSFLQRQFTEEELKQQEEDRKRIRQKRKELEAMWAKAEGKDAAAAQREQEERARREEERKLKEAEEKKKAEEARKKAEEEKARIEAEEKKRKEEEERKRKQEEKERKRAEKEERKRREAEERKRQEEEERKKREEEERKKKEEEEKRKAEEEARRLAEEKKRQEEEARRKEEERKRQEDERRLKEEAERAAKLDAEARAAEEFRIKQEQARLEEERKKAEKERKKAEEERQKAEEERKKAEEERKKAEEERQKRLAEEERKKAEEARIKAEQEKARKKAEEEKRKADEERRKIEEEKKKAEEDARRAEERKAMEKRKVELELKKKERDPERRGSMIGLAQTATMEMGPKSLENFMVEEGKNRNRKFSFQTSQNEEIVKVAIIETSILSPAAISEAIKLEDLSDKYVENDFYDLINVNPQYLPQGSKLITSRKARRLWQTMVAVRTLEAQIKEMKRKARQPVPTGKAFRAKIITEGKSAKIIDFTVGDSVDVIRKKAQNEVKFNDIYILQGNYKEEFTNDSIREAITTAASKQASVIRLLVE